jgi:ferredoxin
MDLDAATFSAAARAAGADLIGYAPIARSAGLPPAQHPASIFPETRTVIVLGKRIVRGCLRGAEEGTHLTALFTYGLNWVPDRFLAGTTVAAASVLEDHGWEAVPLPNLPPQIPPLGVSVGGDRPAPNVMLDFTDAAVRAGLGHLGFSGELMTPRFGHRQALQLILTDAPLEGTPSTAREVCTRCRSCAAACPLGAVTGEDTRRILDHDYTVARYDEAVCNRCRNGAQRNRHHPTGSAHRLGAACLRACAAACEPRLADQFTLPFRRRPAWAVGADGQSRPVEDR